MTQIYEKYKDELKLLLSVDDRTLAILDDEYDRAKPLKRRSRLDFWTYLCLALITKIVFTVKGIHRRFTADGEDFVYVSCPDPVFRTKNIDLIARGLKYTVLYLPNFHVGVTLKYARYFRGKINAAFLSFSIADVLKAHYKLSKALFLKEVKENLGEEEYSKLRHQLFTYLVYDQVVRRSFGNVSGFRGKWIFEHQKFYFIPAVHYVMENGRETTMLQHGSFFSPSINYMPLYCDKTLCCSERERQLYLENGVSDDRIVVFGAPLQALGTKEKTEKIDHDYHILILLTKAKTDYLKIQQQTLDFIKMKHKDTRVLLRPRPRSRNTDLVQLSESLQGLDISSEGTPLADDLSRAAKIISFSEDAVFHLLDLDKPFLIIVPDAEKFPTLKGKCADARNYSEYIEELMAGRYQGPFSEEEKKYYLGETDIKLLNRRFCQYIKER